MIVFGNVLRANKDSKTPLYINIGVNLLNIVLNQLLISSHTMISVLGISICIPGAGWGVKGAAVATAVSQGIGRSCNLFCCNAEIHMVTLKGMKVKPERKLLKNCMTVSLPLMGERIVMGCGYVVFSSLVAGLGTLSVAAHSIALTIEQAFYVPGYGIQTAVSTLSGNAVGKKDELELESVVRSGLIVAVSIMTAMAIGLFCGAEVIIGCFTKDGQVIALGTVLLRIVALSEPLYAALIIYEGVFHGIGDTKMPFVFAILTMWGIRICMTWIYIRLFGNDLKMVWIFMVMDNISRCLLLWRRYRRRKKKLTVIV